MTMFTKKIGPLPPRTDMHGEDRHTRAAADKPRADSFTIGAPPVFMIAMAGWGWLTKWRGKKAEPAAAAQQPKRPTPRPLDIDPGIMIKDVVERELADKNGGTSVNVIENPEDLAEVFARGGGNAYKASLSYVLVHHGAARVQQFRVSRDLEDVDMIREGEIVLGAGTCLSLPTMGDLLILNGKGANFETLSDCIMTNNGRDDIGGMDKVVDHLESIGIVNVRHEKSAHLADAYLGIVASSANMDSLSAEAYGASPEVAAREKELRQLNKGAPVYTVICLQQLESLMRRKEPEKYNVIELADGSYEVRTASEKNPKGRPILHDRMFLPKDGEKVVGAGYWRYDPAAKTLNIDGNSGGFPTENESIMPDMVLNPSHLAGQTGLTAVIGILQTTFPSVTITC